MTCLKRRGAIELAGTRRITIVDHGALQENDDEEMPAVPAAGIRRCAGPPGWTQEIPCAAGNRRSGGHASPRKSCAKGGIGEQTEMCL
jgi:hypothetical protein